MARTPEPASISSGVLQSAHYGAAMKTPMAAIYALALDAIWRTQNSGARGETALELCSGPGRFSSLALRALGLKEILGVDLSDTMLEQSRIHAVSEGIAERAKYLKADVTRIASEMKGRKFDLVMFMNGAHHLEGPAAVRSVLKQASDCCTDEGIVFVLDPVRPKSKRLLNYFSETVYRQYEDPGLTEFYKDYVDSLHASYTVQEFKECIPEGTGRRWIHILPGLVPATQMLIGLPRREAVTPAKEHRSEPRRLEISEFVPKTYRLIYWLMRLDFKIGALFGARGN